MKIIKISDTLAERVKGEISGEIMYPEGLPSAILCEMVLKRIDKLNGRDVIDGNNARLSKEQEILFLEKITRRLGHE